MRRPVDEGRHRARGFTLVEMLAVLVVVSIAARVVLAHLPDVAILELHAAGASTVERLSVARERAILEGRAVRVNLRDALPPGMRAERLDGSGNPSIDPAMSLLPDGDPLPQRVRLSDETGAAVEIVVPAGFGRARLVTKGIP
jgi:prepilin-type N-terminal cleavage/methylation domain-containing protein